MDVTLHIGAHRTGTSTFQDYMRRHVDALASEGVGYWGPGRRRRGVFRRIASPSTKSKRGRLHYGADECVKMQLKEAQERGIHTLIVSDENVAGTVRGNIDEGCLYNGIGARVSRFARAFEGHITTVVFCPRSLELYWSSALSHGLSRGQAVPDRNKLRGIALSKRGWRDVITDLARAVPEAELKIMPFERFAGRPEVFLERATGIQGPKDTSRQWLNRAPNLPDLRRVLKNNGNLGAVLPFGMGRWNPFTPEENAALRETFADDMMWLVAGANGLATLTEDQARERTGKTPSSDAQAQGHGNEFEERQVAQPG
ncbi:hypothetical protein [Roseobacter sp.]|uniref:hypothetical protein n=1 Tax=Roseobacter sp. TaxID=1907202 RepID=UPI00385B39E8